MKAIMVLIGLFITSNEVCGQIFSPKFKRADVPQCEIMHIGATDSATHVFFKFTDDKQGAICINEEYHIKDNQTGRKYKLLNSINIPVCPSSHVFDSLNKIHYFGLSFEPLPKETTEIDLIESNDNNGFNFYGVSLKKDDSQISPSKIDFIDLLENSPVREMGYFLKDGRTVQYNIYKGLAIGVHLSIEKAYGKYYTAYISIENNTGKRIDFYPELIRAYVYQGDKEFECEVLTYNEYLKKVKNQQAWNSFFVALGESSAANQAGHSTSVTQSTSTSNSVSNGYYSGYYGNKYGAVSSNVRTYGTSTTTSTTYNYDGTANYYARQNANRNITAYNYQQSRIVDSIDQGYLKANTIFKEQRLNGYINVLFKKGDVIYIDIPINNEFYSFMWPLK